MTFIGHPDLLFQAFQNGYGTDRSTAAFAAGKVRFVDGVNIGNDLSRTLQPTARKKVILVRGLSSDPAKMRQVIDSGAPEGEAAVNYGLTDDPDVLDAVGAANIALRKAQSDIAIFPIVPGDDDTVGLYHPSWPGDGGHFWLGDTVTIASGSGELDFDDLNLRVAAISATLGSGPLWEITVELGATYYDFGKPGEIQGSAVPPGGGCTCPTPGPVCVPASGGATIIDWNWGSGVEPTLITDHCTTGPASANWGQGLGSGDGSVTGYYTPLNHDAGTRTFPVTAGDNVTVDAIVWPFNNDPIVVVNWYDSGCSLLSSDILYCGVIGDGWNTLSGSATAPTGAAYACVVMGTGGGACSWGVGFTGYVQRLTVTGASIPDALCAIGGAYGASNPPFVYGSDYAPSGSGRYVEIGSTIPAPRADQVPYANTDSGLAATDVQAAIDEDTARIAALEATPAGVEVKETDGSPDVTDVSTIRVPQDSLTDDGSGQITLALTTARAGGRPTAVDHGTVGSTETVDAANGNHHNLTLGDDLVLTLAGFPTGGITFSLEQDGSGNHGLTLSGATAVGDIQPGQDPGDVTDYICVSAGGVLRVYKAGGGGISATGVPGHGLFYNGTTSAWASAQSPEPLLLEDGSLAILESGRVAMSEPIFD